MLLFFYKRLQKSNDFPYRNVTQLLLISPDYVACQRQTLVTVWRNRQVIESVRLWQE